MQKKQCQMDPPWPAASLMDSRSDRSPQPCVADLYDSDDTYNYNHKHQCNDLQFIIIDAIYIYINIYNYIYIYIYSILFNVSNVFFSAGNQAAFMAFPGPSLRLWHPSPTWPAQRMKKQRSGTDMNWYELMLKYDDMYRGANSLCEAVQEF